MVENSLGNNTHIGCPTSVLQRPGLERKPTVSGPLFRVEEECAPKGVMRPKRGQEDNLESAKFDSNELKGACANFGAHRLEALCQTVEGPARAEKIEAVSVLVLRCRRVARAIPRKRTRN